MVLRCAMWRVNTLQTTNPRLEPPTVLFDFYLWDLQKALLKHTYSCIAKTVKEYLDNSYL